MIMEKNKFLDFSCCRLLCCLGLVAILTSCQRNLDGKGVRIDISQSTPRALEKLFTSAKVIPLETTDSSLIARIDKIVLFLQLM